LIIIGQLIHEFVSQLIRIINTEQGDYKSIKLASKKTSLKNYERLVLTKIYILIIVLSVILIKIQVETGF